MFIVFRTDFYNINLNNNFRIDLINYCLADMPTFYNTIKYSKVHIVIKIHNKPSRKIKKILRTKQTTEKRHNKQKGTCKDKSMGTGKRTNKTRKI